MGSKLLQKAVFPTQKHLKHALSMMDLSFKIEFLLFEFVATLFWSSFLEMGIFVLVFVIYLEDSSELGSIWFFLPHLARGVIGALIMRGVPKTHEIIKNASFPANQKMKNDDIILYLTRAAK